MTALDLRGTLEWFATAISNGDDVEQGIACAARTGALLEDVVTPSRRMSARDRLGVYHHAYRARLVECLADDYPALQYALGNERFEGLCHDYVARGPSTSFSLNFFGSRMAAYCRTRPEPWAHFASELASLEWAIVEAIHAPAAAALDASALGRLSVDEWGARRLVPSATLRVLRSRYPTNAYFQAFREGTARSAPPMPERSVTAVSRSGMTVWRTHVPLHVAPVLNSLVGGATLGEALDSVGAEESDVASAFHAWMSAGMFVGIE